VEVALTNYINVGPLSWPKCDDAMSNVRNMSANKLAHCPVQRSWTKGIFVWFQKAMIDGPRQAAVEFPEMAVIRLDKRHEVEIVRVFRQWCC
jgi:hypothetical protein